MGYVRDEQTGRFTWIQPASIDAAAAPGQPAPAADGLRSQWSIAIAGVLGAVALVIWAARGLTDHSIAIRRIPRDLAAWTPTATLLIRQKPMACVRSA